MYVVRKVTNITNIVFFFFFGNIFKSFVVAVYILSRSISKYLCDSIIDEISISSHKSGTLILIDLHIDYIFTCVEAVIRL